MIARRQSDNAHRVDKLIIWAFIALAFVFSVVIFWPKVKKNDPNCYNLDPPIVVFCDIEDTPLLAELTSKVCQYHDPERWTIFPVNAEPITLIGGACFAATRLPQPPVDFSDP